MNKKAQPPAAGVEPVEAYPVPRSPAAIPEFTEGPYTVRFVESKVDLERVQRLRFEVFNLELEEGLDSSYATGLDADRFDGTCHHLMLIDDRSGELVGTYRLQTATMARGGEGFYCASEYDLAQLPDEILDDSVELGRACVLKEHRNGTALYGLWRGLASYMVGLSKRYFFGCCSLTSQDPRDGLAMYAKLRNEGRLHPIFHVDTLPEMRCEWSGSLKKHRVDTPKLFHTYMRYGVKVVSPPALDREFGTIDFLVMFDRESISSRVQRLFFEDFERVVAGRA